MKQLITILFLLLTSDVNAQDYLPILKQGRVWKCVVRTPSWDIPRPFTVTVAGDTIVNERKMFKVSIVFDKLEGYNNRENSVMPAYEEDGQVWTLGEKGSDKATLLIDMNLHKGDNIAVGTVSNVDTITVNGVKRKRIKAHGFDGGVYWVEGIGASHDFWAGYDGKINNGEYAYMKECYDNGELIFTKDDFRTGLADGINKVTRDVKDDNAMHDIGGRHIKEPQPGSVYIKGGSKYYKHK